MRLVLSTPFDILVDTQGVARVQAEDATGSFGILDHHDRLVTVLSTSIVTWSVDGTEHFAAVDRGVLINDKQRGVRIASRRAEVSDDLERLETQILESFREAVDREERARQRARRVELDLLKRLRRYAGHGRYGALPGVGQG
ncbi:MAG: F0F1 ATP synthase subunit epsilon [Bradymonadaceae bacterium]